MSLNANYLLYFVQWPIDSVNPSWIEQKAAICLIQLQ